MLVLRVRSFFDRLRGCIEQRALARCRGHGGGAGSMECNGFLRCRPPIGRESDIFWSEMRTISWFPQCMADAIHFWARGF